MGACLAYIVVDDLPHNEIKAVFEDRCEQSRYENGCAYSGDIGMKRGISRFIDRGIGRPWQRRRCPR